MLNLSAPNSLRADLLTEYLAPYTLRETVIRGPRRIVHRTFLNGKIMEKTDIAIYYACRSNGKKNSGIDFFIADNLLTPYRLSIDDFMLFCEQRGQSPWMRGKPPTWYNEDWTHE